MHEMEKAQRVLDFLVENREDPQREGWYSLSEIWTGLPKLKVGPIRHRMIVSSVALANDYLLSHTPPLLEDGWFKSLKTDGRPSRLPDLERQYTWEEVRQFDQHYSARRFYRAIGYVTLAHEDGSDVVPVPPLPDGFGSAV